MDEAFEFSSQKAFEDFGVSHSSFEFGNFEINFDSKECIEKERKKNNVFA